MSPTIQYYELAIKSSDYDIRDRFIQFNDDYFGGKIPTEINLEFAPLASQKVMGLFRFSRVKTDPDSVPLEPHNCTIILDTSYEYTQAGYDGVLLHEMVHAYVMMVLNNRDMTSGGHHAQFWQILNDVDAKARLRGIDMPSTESGNMVEFATGKTRKNLCLGVFRKKGDPEGMMRFSAMLPSVFDEVVENFQFKVKTQVADPNSIFKAKNAKTAVTRPQPGSWAYTELFPKSSWYADIDWDEGIVLYQIQGSDLTWLLGHAGVEMSQRFMRYSNLVAFEPRVVIGNKSVYYSPELYGSIQRGIKNAIGKATVGADGVYVNGSKIHYAPVDVRVAMGGDTRPSVKAYDSKDTAVAFAILMSTTADRLSTGKKIPVGGPHFDGTLSTLRENIADSGGPLRHSRLFATFAALQKIEKEGNLDQQELAKDAILALNIITQYVTVMPAPYEFKQFFEELSLFNRVGRLFTNNYIMRNEAKDEVDEYDCYSAALHVLGDYSDQTSLAISSDCEAMWQAIMGTQRGTERSVIGPRGTSPIKTYTPSMLSSAPANNPAGAVTEREKDLLYAFIVRGAPLEEPIFLTRIPELTRGGKPEQQVDMTETYTLSDTLREKGVLEFTTRYTSNEVRLTDLGVLFVSAWKTNLQPKGNDGLLTTQEERALLSFIEKDRSPMYVSEIHMYNLQANAADNNAAANSLATKGFVTWHSKDVGDTSDYIELTDQGNAYLDQWEIDNPAPADEDESPGGYKPMAGSPLTDTQQNILLSFDNKDGRESTMYLIEVDAYGPIPRESFNLANTLKAASNLSLDGFISLYDKTQHDPSDYCYLTDKGNDWLDAYAAGRLYSEKSAPAAVVISNVTEDELLMFKAFKSADNLQDGLFFVNFHPSLDRMDPASARDIAKSLEAKDYVVIKTGDKPRNDKVFLTDKGIAFIENGFKDSAVVSVAPITPVTTPVVEEGFHLKDDRIYTEEEILAAGHKPTGIPPYRFALTSTTVAAVAARLAVRVADLIVFKTGLNIWRVYYVSANYNGADLPNSSNAPPIPANPDLTPVVDTYLAEGWTEASPGGMATNPDPVVGGIIDHFRGNDTKPKVWFIILNGYEEKPEGFASRHDAFIAAAEYITDHLSVPERKALESWKDDPEWSISPSVFLKATGLRDVTSVVNQLVKRELVERHDQMLKLTAGGLAVVLNMAGAAQPIKEPENAPDPVPTPAPAEVEPTQPAEAPATEDTKPPSPERDVKAPKVKVADGVSTYNISIGVHEKTKKLVFVPVEQAASNNIGIVRKREAKPVAVFLSYVFSAELAAVTKKIRSGQRKQAARDLATIANRTRLYMLATGKEHTPFPGKLAPYVEKEFGEGLAGQKQFMRFMLGKVANKKKLWADLDRLRLLAGILDEHMHKGKEEAAPKKTKFVIYDSPLNGASVVWRGNDKAKADKTCEELNKTNHKQRGPWAGGRYWVDENASFNEAAASTDEDDAAAFTFDELAKTFEDVGVKGGKFYLASRLSELDADFAETRKMKGVKGVSSSKKIWADFSPNAGRDVLFIMGAKPLMQANHFRRVGYDNVEKLIANNCRILCRIFSTTEPSQNAFDNVWQRISSKLPRHGDDYVSVGNKAAFIARDLTKNRPIEYEGVDVESFHGKLDLSTVEAWRHLIHEGAKAAGWYGRDSVKFFAKQNRAKWYPAIYNGILLAASIYADEAEWVNVNGDVNIPVEGTRILVAMDPEYQNGGPQPRPITWPKWKDERIAEFESGIERLKKAGYHVTIVDARKTNLALEGVQAKSRARITKQRETAAEIPDLVITDELLAVARQETKALLGLVGNAVENDQNGIRPGKLRILDQGVIDGDYTLADVTDCWRKSIALIKRTYGNTVMLYRADAPKKDHGETPLTVYMATRDMATKFHHTGRKLYQIPVKVSDIVGVNTPSNTYVELIVKFSAFKHAKVIKEEPDEYVAPKEYDVVYELRGDRIPLQRHALTTRSLDKAKAFCRDIDNFPESTIHFAIECDDGRTIFNTKKDGLFIDEAKLETARGGTQENGVYAAVKFTKQTQDYIGKWLKANNIPNAIDVAKIHSTLMYSRRPLYSPWESMGTYAEPIVVDQGTFKFDVFGESKRCLVLKYESAFLTRRYKQARGQGATWDYPTFVPHITLSYDLGDFDISNLRLPNFKLRIVSEYTEPLELKWAESAALWIVYDSPLETAKVVFNSRSRDEAIEQAKALNTSNAQGPWGMKRYWVDETALHGHPVIDNKHESSWGQVPDNTEIDYKGQRVMMRPSKFLELALPLHDKDIKDIVEHMEKGGAIASPFLTLQNGPEWDDGDYSKMARVISHDGRHRMLAIQKLFGDDPVEVHLIMQSSRARHWLPEWFTALKHGIKSQDGHHIVQNAFK